MSVSEHSMSYHTSVFPGKPQVCCEIFNCGLIRIASVVSYIDIEYNKRLDRQRPCLEDDLTAGSNNIVQSNKSV